MFSSKFRCVDIVGRNFKNKLSLPDAGYDFIKFKKCEFLEGISMKGIVANNVIFEDCFLIDSDFEDLHVNDLFTAHNTTFWVTSFAGAHFEALTANHIKLNYCNFDESILNKGAITNSNIFKSSFNRAKITESDFWNDNFSRCNFNLATLDEVSFLTSTIDENCTFDGVELSSVELPDARIIGFTF